MDDQPFTSHRAEARCIACRSATSEPALRFGAIDVGIPAREVRRCRACGHHFLADWDVTYDVALYDYYGSRLDVPKEQAYDALTTRRLHEVLVRLRPAGGRLLDVGCGEGQLVDTALAAGLDARGIDVSLPAIAICQRFGLPCTADDLFAATLDDERFDVITLVETIEHVPDPTAMLARALELLAPGGVVWLTTPNMASLGRRILGSSWPVLSPEHLSYFTPDSLRGTANRAGFTDVSLSSRTVSAAALRALVRRPRPAPASDPGTPPGADAISADFADEQRFRHRIESQRLLRSAKSVLNTALSVTRLGETLVAELRCAAGGSV
jgi:SAM-dependent methyltransferase